MFGFVSVNLPLYTNITVNGTEELLNRRKREIRIPTLDAKSSRVNDDELDYFSLQHKFHFEYLR